MLLSHELVINQPAEPVREVLLRRSHSLIRLAISMICASLCDFNISQSNYPNSFDEAMFCSDSDSWFTVIQEELIFMHDNHPSDLVDLLDILNRLAISGSLNPREIQRVTLSTLSQACCQRLTQQEGTISMILFLACIW